MSRAKHINAVLGLLIVAVALQMQQVHGQGVSDTLRFAFISDLHFGKTDYNGESLYPALWLRKAIAGVERKKAEFIFLGGDLIESSNSAAQYTMFDSAMVTALPWYPMPGNHDVGADPQSATMDKITAWIQRGYGRGAANREYYGFVKKNVGAFFVLNTQAYISTDPAVSARADSQLVDMDAFFAQNASVPNKFVCSHVPLFEQKQLEDSAYFNIGKSYRARIIALMNKHKTKYYLAGHRHENAVVNDNDITVYTNTALSFQLGSGNQRGYYIYTVTATSVKRDFYPLALEPDVVRWKWIAYGDTRTNDAAHRSVLQSIRNNTLDYKFIINVGDDVEDGNSAYLWNGWKAACDQILGGTGQTNVPPKYMTAPGNHEMLESGGLPNWRTYMSGQVTQFGNDGKYFTFDYENARFVVLYSETATDLAQKQLLVSAVETNPKKWLFAIWHRPIFDFGVKVYEGGIHQNWGVPLHQNGCDIFFTGHAHQYVRSKKLNLNGQMNPPLDPVKGTVQIITGNGGAPLAAVDENHDGNGYLVAYSFDQNASPFYGYTELTVDGDTLFLRHLSASGQVMDQEVYYPNFKPHFGARYHLNIQTTGSGSVLKTPSDSVYVVGTRVQIYADAALGWKFDGWSGDRTGTLNPDTVVMDGEKTITATFSQIPAGQYEVRTRVIGSGIVVASPAGPYYSLGAVVTLKARSNAGNKFNGWSGSVSGTDTVVTVTVDGHKSVTATFSKLESYRINVRPGLHGSATLDPAGGVYIEGTEVTLRAQGETGWEFYEWLGDVNGKTSMRTITVDADKDVRAVFRKSGGGVQGISANHDSYVQGFLKASTNFNADSCLRVREGSSDMNRCRAYVQFDVGGIVGNVLGAVIKMRVRETGLPDGRGVGAGVYGVSSDSWTESTLKWNGAPVAGTLLDTVTVSSAGMYYGWDVGTYVGGEAGGDKVVSVMVKDHKASDKLIDFERREDGKGPVLEVLTDAPTGVEREEVVPKEYALHQNYPNPFNPRTTIKYDLVSRDDVSIQIYDILGRRVRSLIEEKQGPGTVSIAWDGRDDSEKPVESGIYLLRLRVGAHVQNGKMILLK